MTNSQAPETLIIRNARFPKRGSALLETATVVVTNGVVTEILPANSPTLHATSSASTHVIEADGRVAMPGFIDAHSHAEGALHRDEVEHGLLRQGVTGVVIGQDGVSFAPTTPESAPLNERYFSAINGPLPLGYENGMSIANVLSHFSRATRLNAAMLVPAGTVRSAVTGFAQDPLTERQRDEAAQLVRDALTEGAVGISLGLEYVPGGFADPKELATYASIAAEEQVPLVAHVRGYELAAPGGLGECIDLAKVSGAPLHISHLHAPADIALPIIDQARHDGVDITFDSYPYHRGNTILAMLALPPELQQGGPQRTLDALADRSQRAALIADWFPTIEPLYEKLTVSVAAHRDWAWAEGKRLGDIAEKAGLSTAETICEMLVATELGVGAVVNHAANHDSENLRTIANHEAHMGGSDGIYLGSHPHPRGWGSFARMLRRHVIDWKDWNWADAADHLSHRAADRFGFGNRGRAEIGSVADFVLVDPESLNDAATYESPTLPAHGMMEVTVTGTSALSGGKLTQFTPGRAIRRSSRRRAL
ncbi:N-acyl-D-amino-acid deacylase family protein [Leucobacter chinensis]|uniref:N-acyl-D-amino-acid deacylase family protein n=1 Tax=Leucobacter chinensis TaxID=2851010 RepID=UPI001C2365B5